jgi:hypothetical protein
MLMKLEFSRQIFEKSLNIKCHKNPSSGIQVVPCGQTDGRATVAFRNFANALKNKKLFLNAPHKSCSNSSTFLMLLSLKG